MFRSFGTSWMVNLLAWPAIFSVCPLHLQTHLPHWVYPARERNILTLQKWAGEEADKLPALAKRRVKREGKTTLFLLTPIWNQQTLPSQVVDPAMQIPFLIKLLILGDLLVSPVHISIWGVSAGRCLFALDPFPSSYTCAVPHILILRH